MKNNFYIIAPVCLFAGIWQATQSLAKSVKYDALLGSPLFVWNNTQVYAPYKIIEWYLAFYEVIPKLFFKAFIWVFVFFVAGIIISLVTEKRELTAHGSAAWATWNDIKKAKLFSNKGVVFGRMPKLSGLKKILSKISDKYKYFWHDGPEHMLVMAPTRSGKGVGIIIPTLFTWADSLIVTDVKKENWEITSGYRQKHLNNKVIKFEPTSDDGTSARFNPFEEVRIRTSREVADVQNITNILVDPTGKGELDHWQKSAQSLLVGCILHLLYTDPNPSLGRLIEFLTSVPEGGTGFEDVLKIMQEYDHDLEHTGIFKKIYTESENVNQSPYTHPIVKQSATDMLNKADKERASVVSTATSILAIYRDPVIAYNLSASDFKIEDLMNYSQPVTLYLVFPPSDIDRMIPVFRLIIELIVRRNLEKMEFKDGKAVKSYKYKMLLLLDEFPILGRMDTFERALAYIAGYGMKALLITQALPQLNKTYTKDNSIIANCHVRIFYTPNDDETPGLISKALGKYTQVVYNESRNMWSLFKNSESSSLVGRDLLTPDEVGKLPGDEELIFVTGIRPIKANKIFYYNDPFFTKRIMAAPPKSDIIRQNTPSVPILTQDKENELTQAWEDEVCGK